jgi:thiosulfate dehydrogenase (quinone) large subunit
MMTETSQKRHRDPQRRWHGCTVHKLLQRLDDLDRRCRGVVLGLGRITLGLLWLANIHWKVPGDFGEANGGGLYKYSSSVSRNSTFAPFTWVTEQFVLPNFGFFGWFTLVTEIALAALLIVGYRTKIVALAGAAMSVPIMLSVLYYDKADEWSWSYLLMIAAHLMAYASDAGNHLGVDLRR